MHRFYVICQVTHTSEETTWRTSLCSGNPTVFWKADLHINGLFIKIKSPMIWVQHLSTKRNLKTLPQLPLPLYTFSMCCSLFSLTSPYLLLYFLQQGTSGNFPCRWFVWPWPTGDSWEHHCSREFTHRLKGTTHFWGSIPMHTFGRDEYSDPAKPFTWQVAPKPVRTAHGHSSRLQAWGCCQSKSILTVVLSRDREKQLHFQVLL